MQELRNISLSRTTHAELSEITNAYISIIKKHLSDHEFLINLTTMITPKLDDLYAALAAVRLNSLIEEVSDLDRYRDDAYMTFRDMIKAYERTDIEKEKKAYNELWVVLKKIGTNLSNEGYTEQSGMLEALFQEFDKTNYETTMGILGVTSRYKKLKIAEENFKTTYANRLAEDTRKKYPTLNASRAALMPLISDLIPTLRNIARTLDKDTDTGWIDLMNEQNDKLMIQITARKTRKANEKTEA